MLYRPRMLARLFVPLPDEKGDYGGTSYDVPVIRASWTKNDPGHADELEIEVDYNDAGVDPRLLSGANVLFYLGDADESGGWQPLDEDLRFAGRIITPERSLRSDALRVSLKFLDYTSYFLAAKPVAVDALPLYRDTLSQAWRRLCESVPGADAFVDAIEFRGATDAVIGGAVASRFSQTSAHVPIQPNDDAWAIWANTCGMLGLITFFDVDRVVVTTEGDYFTAGDAPRLIWGTNIEELEERRQEDFAAVGIIIQSFDPQKGVIEAMWPPPGSPQLLKRNFIPKARKKAPTAKQQAQATAKLLAAEQRVAFVYPQTTDPAELLKIAKKVYAVRSRQALEGRLVTAEMRVDRASGAEFDLLSLSSGDVIEIRLLDDEATEKAGALATPDERIAYLVERGYQPQVAKIIAANIDTLGKSASLFHVKAVQVDFDNSGQGSFKVSIDFMNKIDAGATETG